MNRIAIIVARIMKRFAVEISHSEYGVFEVIKMAKNDPKAEVFIYDIVLTNKIYRKSLLEGSHFGIVKSIYEKNHGETVTDLNGLYDRVVRGYWLPERNEMYFHVREGNGSGFRKYVCPDSSIVSAVLSDMKVDPEGIFCMMH